MKRLLLLLCLWVAWGVRAQTDVPFAYDTLTQLVFPHAIIFEASVALPGAEVARAVLTIAPPVGAPLVVDMPRDVPFAFAKEYVVANYRWNIPSSLPLALGDTIAYTWQLVTVRDEVALVESELVYQDERVPAWERVANDDQTLTLTAPQGIDGLDVARLHAALLPIYDRLAAETGARPALRWLLYSEQLPLGCNRDADGVAIVTYRFKADEITERCDEARINRLFADYRVEVFNGETAWLDAATDTLVTTFYAPFWNDDAPPAWLRAATIQLYKPYPRYDQPDLLRQMLRVQRPLTLAQMATVPDDPQQRVLWQAQAESLLLYLMDKFGVPAALKTLREAGSVPFEAAFARLSGADASALLPSWQSWLYSARAAQAYGYSIYQPVTATPTATFTPSPTATASPLPPSPTATDDATATPRPTRTRIPPTATVTPLPPSGFTVRATPLPEPAVPVPLGITGDNAVLFGGGILGVVLLFLLGVWLWRRNR